jgi:hypothetical protein
MTRWSKTTVITLNFNLLSSCIGKWDKKNSIHTHLARKNNQ